MASNKNAPDLDTDVCPIFEWEIRLPVEEIKEAQPPINGYYGYSMDEDNTDEDNTTDEEDNNDSDDNHDNDALEKSTEGWMNLKVLRLAMVMSQRQL